MTARLALPYQKIIDLTGFVWDPAQVIRSIESYMIIVIFTMLTEISLEFLCFSVFVCKTFILQHNQT